MSVDPVLKQRYNLIKQKIETVNTHYTGEMQKLSDRVDELSKEWKQVTKDDRRALIEIMLDMTIRQCYEVELNIEMGLIEIMSMHPLTDMKLRDVLEDGVEAKLLNDEINMTEVLAQIFNLSKPKRSLIYDILKSAGAKQEGQTHVMHFDTPAEAREFLKMELGVPDEMLDEYVVRKPEPTPGDEKKS